MPIVCINLRGTLESIRPESHPSPSSIIKAFYHSDLAMTQNPSSTNLPWASFSSFRLPPFASFINSNHSYIRAESPVEQEEGRDSPPLSNESFASPYDGQRQSTSPYRLNPQILQPSSRPDKERIIPQGQEYVSPIVFQQPSTPSHASHRTSSRPTSPQSPLPRLASPPHAGTQPSQISPASSQHRPVLSPRRLSNLAVSIVEPSFAGPFTRRFAPPFNTPSPTLPGPESHPFSGAGTALEPYLVDWLPGEPANPYNWNIKFKWILTVHLAINCLCPVFATSSFVGAYQSILDHFPDTTTEVALLGLSLFLLGMC